MIEFVSKYFRTWYRILLLLTVIAFTVSGLILGFIIAHDNSAINRNAEIAKVKV